MKTLVFVLTSERAGARPNSASACDPIPKVEGYLRSVICGHYSCYGVPRNGHALRLFRHAVTWLWRRTLRRWSQKHRRARHLRRRFERWVDRFIRRERTHLL